MAVSASGTGAPGSDRVIAGIASRGGRCASSCSQAQWNEGEVLVIPEKSEINHIVVIIGAHKQNIYSAYWCHGVYLLKKDAARKWVGSNPDAALEYSAEVNVSHSDRIDIAVECGEDETYRTVATRKECPLFVDVDLTRKYVNNRVTTVFISGSEKNSLSFENSKRAYIAIRSDGVTTLCQNVTPVSEGLKVYELPRGRGWNLKMWRRQCGGRRAGSA